MAEAHADNEKADAPQKRRVSLKTALILAAVLLIEVATVGLTFMLAGGPAKVQAERGGAIGGNSAEREVEELIIQDRFANSKRGDVYLYDTQIYAVVKKKHLEQVQTQLKEQSAQVQHDIAVVFRRAEPSYMHEDELQTLSRQIHRVLSERFGKDENGDSVLKKVLITRCTEYRADL